MEDATMRRRLDRLRADTMERHAGRPTEATLATLRMLDEARLPELHFRMQVRDAHERALKDMVTLEEARRRELLRTESARPPTCAATPRPTPPSTGTSPGAPREQPD
jgi:hypothetical protein